MNKRGDAELMLREVIFIILIVFISFVLVIFVYTASKGYAMKEQRLVKLLALMIDASRPGTTINIYAEGVYKVSLDKEKKEVFVQATENDKGWIYPYFTNNEVIFTFQNNLIKLIFTPGVQS